MRSWLIATGNCSMFNLQHASFLPSAVIVDTYYFQTNPAAEDIGIRTLNISIVVEGIIVIPFQLAAIFCGTF